MADASQIATELEQNKRLALQVRERIENSSEEERRNHLTELYNKWALIDTKERNIFDYLKLAISNFGLVVDNLRIGQFECARKVAIYEVTYLHLFFMQGKMSVEDVTSEDTADIREIKMLFNKIFSAITNAENAIRSSIFLQTSMSEQEYKLDDSDNCLFRFTPIDYSEISSYQCLLLYLLEQLLRKGYRRYKGECYSQIFTEDGFDTHSWRVAMTLKEFIHDVCRKETNYQMWKNLTNSKDNARAAVTYLSEYMGGEFEDLSRDRHVFSFTNGIYIAKKYNEETGDFYDEFIPYQGPESKTIGTSVVACKYYPRIFDDQKNNSWDYIVGNYCPSFKGIMDYQMWSPEVQRWLCILIGRTMYDLGELEEWQILGYLLGVAATGKSTILTKVVKRIYEACDVGVLSNNIEKKFGLSALADKFVFVGPEIKGNLAMEQSEFQSLISGEDIQVAEKHKVAKSIVWCVPGMLAGNEVPQYTDNAGSISRRLMVFKFDRKVKKGDTKLGKKLDKEIPYIIQACNKAYIEAVNEFGSADIWEIVPPYFKKTKEEMAENTNALTNFLKSDKVIVGEKMYCREKTFVAAFNDHCRENNLGNNRWGNDYYLGPFGGTGIVVKKDIRKRYPNIPGARTHKGTFIIGVDVRTDLGSSRQDVDDSSDEEDDF